MDIQKLKVNELIKFADENNIVIKKKLKKKEIISIISLHFENNNIDLDKKLNESFNNTNSDSKSIDLDLSKRDVKEEESVGEIDVKEEESVGEIDVKEEESVGDIDVKEEESVGDIDVKEEESDGEIDVKEEEPKIYIPQLEPEPSPNGSIDYNYLEQNEINIKENQKLLNKIEEQNKRILELEKNYETILKLVNNIKESNSKNIDESQNEDNEEATEENIIEESNYSLLRNKKNDYEKEPIDIINKLYSIGIRFKNTIDVNSYDNAYVDFMKSNKINVEGVSLYNSNDDIESTDITLSSKKDKAYDLVLCLNLFEYLSDNDIKLYYENMIRISSNYIIIKININNTKKNLEDFLELFNSVVNSQKEYIIQRFITNNLPKNLFILKKDIFEK